MEMHGEEKSHLQHYSLIYHRKEQPNGLFQDMKKERHRASRGGKKGARILWSDFVHSFLKWEYKQLASLEYC